MRRWAENARKGLKMKRIISDCFALEGERLYDGEPILLPGKERRAALKRFEELQKARPGIECKIDIEKRAWER